MQSFSKQIVQIRPDGIVLQDNVPLLSAQSLKMQLSSHDASYYTTSRVNLKSGICFSCGAKYPHANNIVCKGQGHQCTFNSRIGHVEARYSKRTLSCDSLDAVHVSRTVDADMMPSDVYDPLVLQTYGSDLNDHTLRHVSSALDSSSWNLSLILKALSARDSVLILHLSPVASVLTDLHF